MKGLYAVALIALLAVPASAQQQTPMPRYGETDKDKTPSDIESERRAETAYKRSLSNVPDAAAPSDPWGTVRGDGASKSATKAAPVKRAKPVTPAN